ncbi:MAG: DUF5317 domain-containing protein [Actinobacteria bacterium]|jgi:hypothetical protein|nr:DUF5317 domain-containing protein [Actinomycetota bacterium]
MILPVSVLLLIISVPLTGGRLSRLANIEIRWISAILAALALQIWVTTIPTDPTLGTVVHFLSYALGIWFIWVNRKVPGLVVTSSGGAMNLAAIAANGGVMPMSPEAMELAGMTHIGDHFVNSGAVEGARLAWLGDVFAIPASWPLSNVFSIGDVVLVVGVGVMLHRLSRQRDLPEQPPLTTNAVEPAEA